MFNTFHSRISYTSSPISYYTEKININKRYPNADIFEKENLCDISKFTKYLLYAFEWETYLKKRFVGKIFQKLDMKLKLRIAEVDI